MCCDSRSPRSPTPTFCFQDPCYPHPHLLVAGPPLPHLQPPITTVTPCASACTGSASCTPHPFLSLHSALPQPCPGPFSTRRPPPLTSLPWRQHTGSRGQTFTKAVCPERSCWTLSPAWPGCLVQCSLCSVDSGQDDRELFLAMTRGQVLPCLALRLLVCAMSSFLPSARSHPRFLHLCIMGWRGPSPESPHLCLVPVACGQPLPEPFPQHRGQRIEHLLRAVGFPRAPLLVLTLPGR